MIISFRNINIVSIDSCPLIHPDLYAIKHNWFVENNSKEIFLLLFFISFSQKKREKNNKILCFTEQTTVLLLRRKINILFGKNKKKNQK
jgi:hypothetical protein